jgi:hypothetical protein
VLVEQHAQQQRERVAAQQFVGGVVLGDAERGHAHDPAHPPRTMTSRRPVSAAAQSKSLPDPRRPVHLALSNRLGP